MKMILKKIDQKGTFHYKDYSSMSILLAVVSLLLICNRSVIILNILTVFL